MKETETTPVYWKLYYCDHWKGSDHLSETGSEGAMRLAMARAVQRGEDVWLIDPAGKKHLPEVTASQPAPQPAPQPGVKCRLLWPVTDEKYNVIWQKVFTLPFMPRKGDGFAVHECEILEVSLCVYSIDDGMADVFIEAWSRIQATWEEEKRQFEEWGWELWDHGDILPPCFEQD